MVFGPDDPDEGLARIHADADWRPWRIGPVPGRAQQVEARVDRLPGVVSAGEGRDEDADHLVADKLVHDRLVLDQYLRGCRVEAIQQGAEVGGAHGLGQSGGAADIGKEQGALDLRADSAAVQILEAAGAVLGIPRPSPLADEPQDRPARRTER